MTDHVWVFFICRDAARGNTGQGEEVNEAAVMKERTKVIRSCVSFDIPEDESGDSSSDSNDDEAGDGVVSQHRGCKRRHTERG